MVLNVGLLKSGNPAAVRQDIHAIVEVAHDAGALVKVILETCCSRSKKNCSHRNWPSLLERTSSKRAQASPPAGQRSMMWISLMRGVAGGRCGVKASGGIRSFDEARAMVQAGANRIGTSSSVSIVHALGAS